jgi:hypothetical protein
MTSTSNSALYDMKQSFQLLKSLVKIIGELPQGTRGYMTYLESRLDEISAMHPCYKD